MKKNPGQPDLRMMSFKPLSPSSELKDAMEPVGEKISQIVHLLKMKKSVMAKPGSNQPNTQPAEQGSKGTSKLPEKDAENQYALPSHVPW